MAQVKECLVEPILIVNNFVNLSVLRQKYYIHECESVNLHFSDSGLFGLNFTGSSANSKEMLNDMLEVLDNFRKPISEAELTRTKNILKRNILLNLSNQGDRLEELARSVICN